MGSHDSAAFLEPILLLRNATEELTEDRRAQSLHPPHLLLSSHFPYTNTVHLLREGRRFSAARAERGIKSEQRRYEEEDKFLAAAVGEAVNTSPSTTTRIQRSLSSRLTADSSNCTDSHTDSSIVGDSEPHRSKPINTRLDIIAWRRVEAKLARRRAYPLLSRPTLRRCSHRSYFCIAGLSTTDMRRSPLVDCCCMRIHAHVKTC